MALASLAKLKTQLGLKSSDTQWDDKLNFFLDAASDTIESICQRKFAQATYTEIFSGNRGDTLVPMQYPVTSLTELRVDGSRTWTDPNTLVPATDLGLSSDGLAIVRYSGTFPLGRDIIRAIYVAGYANIPNDLQLAVIWAAEWYYRHNQRGDMGRTSTSKQDESVGIVQSMPTMIKEIVQRYKRMEFPTINLPVRNP